ncbi:hypothetical protein [Emticicia sp. C21]|uniref:hypothetical protein n=1 Tax=Emticicia sp. C21 TaxID=2302915 RepID=UPI000E845A03|nr:hypothetical protein [Emticicia sp. C21]RFS14264.1 hypothetical protein D0T08_22250 [Emticicia sp. C21]
MKEFINFTMEEKPITRNESLLIIESMIETTKKKITKLDSYYSLMWGYLVLIASFLNYYLLSTGYGNQSYLAWCLMIVGAVASLALGLKQKKSQKISTYFDKVLIFLWSGFMICILILILNMQFINFQIIPLILLLYGIALFVNGGILKFTPQIIGAIVAWIGCFIAFRVEMKEQLLVTAAVVVIAYIIPGHILFNKAQKNV